MSCLVLFPLLFCARSWGRCYALVEHLTNGESPDRLFIYHCPNFSMKDYDIIPKREILIAHQIIFTLIFKSLFLIGASVRSQNYSRQIISH